MLAFDPLFIDPEAGRDGRTAFAALADAAASYLRRLERAVQRDGVPARGAWFTRVRGTGPGVHFGDLVRAMERAFRLRWTSPFEGSANVCGAELPASEALHRGRDDGFLFLRFNRGTRDLPFHVHPESDRFIIAIGGRGFFHVSPEPLERFVAAQVHHLPIRDRDALMFRRGTVHTFSTAEAELCLLSYHRPFVALTDARRYLPVEPHTTPEQLLRRHQSRISFDRAWNEVG